MHELRLNELKKKACTEIKTEKINPMNPKNKRVVKDPLPAFSMSQTVLNAFTLVSKFDSTGRCDAPLTGKLKSRGISV